MTQMKEQNTAPKIELNDEMIANLWDAEFKIPVIRVLKEMTEYSYNIREEIKTRQSEIKKNIQGTNSAEKEIQTQINDLEQKEEINIQPEQNEETRIQNKWAEA